MRASANAKRPRHSPGPQGSIARKVYFFDLVFFLAFFAFFAFFAMRALHVCFRRIGIISADFEFRE
jgi:hypothetical protein